MASTAPTVMIVGVLYFAGVAASGEETTLQKVFREGLPKYDPAASKAPAPAATQVRSRPQRAKPHPPKPDSASPQANAVQKEPPVMLPRFMVRPMDPPPGARSVTPLPSMIVRQAFRDEPTEQFETASARDARLVRNHLSEFDRYFLNRVTPFGVSKEQRAREAEAIRHSAQEMDAIAELLAAESSDKTSAEEARKLREAYFDTYVARPR